MEEFIQKEMNDTVLKQAADMYDISLDMITYIGGFENFVYEYTKNDQKFILRFVHSGHRSYELVMAEIEFIDYLDHNGASVSTVVHSIYDHIVEQIPSSNGHYFTICVFEKAPGTFVKQEDLTAEFYLLLGSEVGKLHRLTKTFEPKYRRNEWYDEPFRDIAVRTLGKEDQIILDLYDQIVGRIKALPTTADNYGLIHADLHFHNMYYDQKQFTFFDFDDSVYMHFLDDIAIILYGHFQLNKFDSEKYNDHVRYILHNLMLGYQKENQLELDFFKNLNEFIHLRSVILYIVLLAAGFHKHENPNIRNMVPYARKRAIEHSLKIDLDYVLDGLL